MKFHERFDIDVNFDDAQERFVNRVYNEIWLSFFLSLYDNDRYRVHRSVATAIGERYQFHQSIHELIGQNFLKNLQGIEALYEGLERGGSYRRDIEAIVRKLIATSELDLGIEWNSGKFFRKGATVLDDALVNDPLHWLKDQGYESVLKPFEKGLRHLLEAHSRKELFGDVITDMYESVEALAKIVTGRADRDLSANREMFLSKINASDKYKEILKKYIDYANDFRHAAKEGEPKPSVTEHEVESFVYLTGLFIRLAMPA